MKRVHRGLSVADVERLRDDLARRVPPGHAEIGELVKTMRLAARRSQTEYARLCGVAPRVLARIEAGEYNVQVATLEKLLRPFGYRMGVVCLRYDE